MYIMYFLRSASSWDCQLTQSVCFVSTVTLSLSLSQHPFAPLLNFLLLRSPALLTFHKPLVQALT